MIVQGIQALDSLSVYIYILWTLALNDSGPRIYISLFCICDWICEKGSDFSPLRIYNLAYVWPTALKVGMWHDFPIMALIWLKISA